MSKPAAEVLVGILNEANQAPHGFKGDVYDRHADQLGVTKKTLHEWLNSVKAMRSTRKTRSDKGNTALSHSEAAIISAFVMESAKKTGKRLYTVAQAVEILRANDEVKAELVDESSGEAKPLCTSSIERALRNFNLHPEQLRRPPPARQLRSLHPNHWWQIDPSLCVLYYLPGDDLTVMDADKFYKNKPANIDKIKNQRVWRYVITDHTTGTIYVEYVLGAESGENLANCFINAMQFRGGYDPFHGVPHNVMVDAGSANTGAVFKNLCQSLGVHVEVTGVGNPRAKGQVEGANNIVETQFEGSLKFQGTRGLDDLNDKAQRWMRMFNASQQHSRHGMTRFEAWMKINSAQLIKAPDIDTCRALANEKEISRKVDDYMQISFEGDKYSLEHIPLLNNRDTVLIARNPWKADVVRVLREDENGRTVFFEAPKVRVDEFGQNIDGALLGEEYKPFAETPTAKAQKIVEKVAMDATTEAEAEGKRKAKALPFGGRIDPYKPTKQQQEQAVEWMEKRGTESDVKAPTTVLKPLTITGAAKALRGKMKSEWDASYTADLRKKYPTGDVPQEDIDLLVEQFTSTQQAPALRVVGK